MLSFGFYLDFNSWKQKQLSDADQVPTNFPVVWSSRSDILSEGHGRRSQNDVLLSSAGTESQSGAAWTKWTEPDPLPFPFARRAEVLFMHNLTEQKGWRKRLYLPPL
jgi:hypothetical protein